MRFQHEVYPENTTEASRQVLLIQEVEVRDRLATSTINKFLYQYSSEAKPKQSQAPMVSFSFRANGLEHLVPRAVFSESASLFGQKLFKLQNFSFNNIFFLNFVRLWLKPF